MMLLRLAFRNLLRQRRRNGLLGLGIGVGMGVLVLSVSFAEGLSDLIVNNFLANYTGHIELSMTERSGPVKGGLMFRDRDFFEQKVRGAVSNIKRLEEGAMVWVQVVGLGASDNMMTINGLPDSKFERDNKGNLVFASERLKTGDLKAFLGSRSSAMLYERKANDLGLSLGESLQARLRGVSGQAEVLRLEVAATLASKNFYQDTGLYIPIATFKEAAGYRKHEAQSIRLILENPSEAEAAADQLRQALLPPVMAMPLRPIKGSSAAKPKSLLGVALNTEGTDYNLNDDEEVDAERPTNLTNLLPEPILKGYVGLNRRWMRRFGVSEGDRVGFAYESKFRGAVEVFFAAKAVDLQTEVDRYALLPASFWRTYGYSHWPRDLTLLEASIRDDLESDLGQDALVRAWRLMPKSVSSEDIQVNYSKLNATPWSGAALDVRTMQAMGSQFVQLEEAIKSIVALTFLVVAFIILVGVVNTFNLSLRERTWEIGTMRALGFRRAQVAMVFLLEAGCLGVFASAMGVLSALLLAQLISLHEFDNAEAMSLFLRDHRLHFLMRPVPIASFMVMAIVVTVGSAFLPALKASRLRPNTALRRRL